MTAIRIANPLILAIALALAPLSATDAGVRFSCAELVPVDNGAIGMRVTMEEKRVIGNSIGDDLKDFIEFNNENGFFNDILDDQTKHHFIVVRSSGLDPGDYEMLVNGNVHAEFVVEAGVDDGIKALTEVGELGSAGKLVELRRDGIVQFAGLAQGSGADGSNGFGEDDEGRKVRENATLSATLASPGSTGTLTLNAAKKKVTFVIKASFLEKKTRYDLRVNGWVVGQIASNRKGKIKHKFTHKKKSVERRRGSGPLEFDPTQSSFVIERQSDGAAVLTGSLAGGPVDAGLERVSSLRLDLTCALTGLDALGTVEAGGTIGDRFMMILVDGLPEGSHSVYVGMDNIGSVTVSAGVGEIIFANTPLEGEAIMNVDPIGQHVRILDQAGNVLMGTYLPR